MTSILDELDAQIKPVNAPTAVPPVIMIFYTEKPWEPEAGVAVVRAMHERYWNWTGLVVNLRPGEDIAALGPEEAHALYLVLADQFEPDSEHTCGSACPPAV